MTKDIQDNSDFEIVFCEGLLEKNPNFIEALTLLGELYTKKGLYEKGLEVDRKLSHLKPDDAIVFYNLACSYSLLKEIEKSFESLKKAVALGYDELSYMLEDKDLKNLREDKRFQEYFGSLEQQ